jgi:hypothetical protein
MAARAMTLFWPPLIQNPAKNAATIRTHGGAEIAGPISATNATPAKYTTARER